MHRIVATTGEDIRAVEEKKSKQTSLSVIRNIQDRQIEDPQEGTLYICLDGVMVRSNEGKGRWREGKVGFVCTDEREAIGRKGKQSIPDKRYISSFESAKVFGSLVYGEAICMGMRAYKQIILLGDGARWIRALHRQCFRQARYVLDWYHLDDKIYQALKRTLPEDPALRKSLCKRVTHYFWIGRKDDALSLLEDLRAELIKGGLQAVVHQSEGLQVLIEYTCNNWDGIVSYEKMHQEGGLVASSLVEKAADIVVAKRQKKKQGMHWAHTGADGVAALRTLWLNGLDWQEYWEGLRDQKRPYKWAS